MPPRVQENEKERVQLAVRTSNNVMLYQDVLVLRDLVSDAREDLSKLDTEISETQSNNSQLHDKLRILSNSQQRTVEYISQLQAGMGLHRGLSPEILAKIFIHASAGQSIRFPPITSATPWTLSWVCSRWRSVALAERRLWKTVIIASSRREQLPVLREVFSRSGNLNLTLKFIRSSNNPTIFDVIQGNHARIQFLALSVGPTQSTSLGQLSSFERLETLHLEYDILRDTFSKVSSFSLPPSVREICLMSIVTLPVSFDRTGLSFESVIWDNLTSLSILPPLQVYPFLVLNIMERARSLLECRVSLEDDTIDGIPMNVLDPRLIIVQKLQSLTIFLKQYVGQILDSLTLPSLTSLNINGRQGWVFVDSEKPGLIQRSDCQITRFALDFVELEVDNIVPALCAMPNLKILEFNKSTLIPERVIDMINLAPDLEELHMNASSLRGVLALLESRWAEGMDRGIRKGVIYPSFEYYDEEEGDLEELEAAVAEIKAGVHIINARSLRSIYYCRGKYLAVSIAIDR